IKDICWFSPTGQEMSDEAWNAGFVQCLGVRLSGDMIDDINERGEPIVGDTLLLLMNAHYEPLAFSLPATAAGSSWERVVDTANAAAQPALFGNGERYLLQGRSLTLMRLRKELLPPKPAGAVQVEAPAQAPAAALAAAQTP